MNASVVSIQRCADYEEDHILDALRKSLQPFGGMGAFVKSGQKVLLKPNLLSGFAPERAITTHPAVVRATALLVLEQGAQVSVGDSPGIGDITAVLKKCGVADALADLPVTTADFTQTVEFDAPGNTVARKLQLAKAVADADVILTLPKLKTHAQMTFTGALKNQFGLIPGSRKAQYHYRFRDRDWLAVFMIDINRMAKPALAIMDAVVGMEGEGPSGGEPRAIGALLAGPDLAAVDATACRIIGLDPSAVPLNRAARQLGFGAIEPDAIRVDGEPWQNLAIPDFKKVADITPILQLLPLPAPFLNWLRFHWAPRPRIIAERCIQCGNCRRGCPVSPPAIDPQADPNRQVNDEQCIRCYCCHEFCPVKAIELKKTWIGRLLPH